MGKDIVCNVTQEENALFKVVMFTEFDGKIIFLKLLQFWKTWVRSVNELADVGITTLYKLVAPVNINDIWEVQVTVLGNFTYSKYRKVENCPV